MKIYSGAFISGQLHVYIFRNRISIRELFNTLLNILPCKQEFNVYLFHNCDNGGDCNEVDTVIEFLTFLVLKSQ